MLGFEGVVVLSWEERFLTNPTSQASIRADNTLSAQNQHLYTLPRYSNRKKHTLIRRPRLKRRTVPRNGSKVAIVQPIQHRILLFDPRIPLPIIHPNLMMPSCQLIPFLRRHAIVRFDEPASDE